MKKTQLPEKHLIKAYEDIEFLNSADARVIRIMAEYLEPLQRMKKFHVKDTIVFFGSARIGSLEEAQENFKHIKNQLAHATGKREEILRKQLQCAEVQIKNARFYEMARELSFRMTKWALELEEQHRFIIVSGGGPGIMEAANRGAVEAGGQTIGMNISLPFEQKPNPYISEHLSFEFHYFFMRKFWFLFPCKALVVWPGGYGTFDELFDILTLRQTRKMVKPTCIILMDSGFWNEVVRFDRLVEWGMIDAHDLELFHMVDDVDTAFEYLKNHLGKHFVQNKKYWHW
jgi:uncharacterized protein (TIGR00730 family)